MSKTSNLPDGAIFHTPRVLIVTVVLVNVFICLLAAVAIYSSHARYLAGARTDAENLARVLEQNINRMLEKIDAVLYSAAYEYERYRAAGKDDKNEFNGYLDRQLKIVPHAYFLAWPVPAARFFTVLVCRSANQNP